ncbi:serine hydrolase domain-containing protein [Promicromonospora iranensis]|uniref:CubicO group peptidase (Beta-lactamase class C family) n=1 Tax=Promicromonospora iranensis TaxID=1105144 RepID=A0ABU2CGU4_9MICO|nr:serine hydrolase domain-containing protein [Promicromonospora iranensis]MDR7380533.1 CubicO group peptidase (beta-lactamase class C family) [Promicromonospora iranensis]
MPLVPPPWVRRLLAVLAVSLLVAAWSVPARASADEVSALDEEAAAYVSDYVQRHGLPGAAYAVVQDSEVVTVGGAGGVSADTPMPVASVSKSITAFAVLQLVDRGLVDLDGPVTDYLPSFSVGGTDPADITVRMLLDHTSGLPNPMIVPATGDLAADVGHIAQLTVASDPGDAYRYSNLNYWTLAYLVEVVSGEAFDVYLRDEVFAPLGMHDTRSFFTAGGSEVFDEGHVTAYGTSLRIPEMAGNVVGSGGVVSTARDMTSWLAMQQRGGTTADGERLLSADLVEESHTVQTNAGTYGLGWQHTSTADPARVGHDGSLTRWSARVDLVPSSGYGVVVLLDSYTPTFQHPFEISTGLIELTEGRSADPGVPTATIIDLTLAGLTVLVIVLGVRGVLRSRRWADARVGFPGWRFVLRQLPQAVMPVLAGILFLGLTAGRDNPATPVDAFGLWPAATTLVLVAGVIGVVLIAVRTVRWRHTGPSDRSVAPHRRG